MNSQASQAIQPQSLIRPIWAIPAARPIVASVPLSRYRNGKRGWPRRLRSMFRAACRPSWIAAGATPGTGDPSCSMLGEVADDVDLGVAGDCQIGLDPDAPCAVERGAERARQGRGRDARGPEHGPRLDPLGTNVDPFGVDGGDALARADVDAQAGELPPRLLGEVVRVRSAGPGSSPREEGCGPAGDRCAGSPWPVRAGRSRPGPRRVRRPSARPRRSRT